MKKSHRFIHLALTCMSFASGAYAEDKYVTPVQEQVVYEGATRLPEMDNACRKHMSYLRNGGDAFVASLLKSADGCKKQIGSILDKTIKESADACMDSFDPTLRADLERNLEETIDFQGLQCTERDALLAPCPECNNTILAIKPIITTMSTQDLDRSLDLYVDFNDKVCDKLTRKCKPKTSKLEILAQQYGCSDFDLKQAIATVDAYQNEIVDGAQLSALRFKKGPLRAPPRIKQNPIPGPRLLGRSRTDLDPVRIAGGSNSSLNNANRGASQKASSAPQAVSVTDLGKGSKAYVYQDPEHKDQSLVGIDIVDPKTGEKTTLAFPVSPEIAAKIASTKDPIKCLDLLDQAKETALENGLTPADALKNGEKLKQKLAAQNEAQEQAKIANATGQADGKNVAQADSTPAVVKADSGVPIIDKSTAHKSGATTSNAEPSSEKNSTASTKPDSTAETKDSISPEFRVGQGIGPSNGVKIDGIGTGTGLKYGGGVGLRGTQKMQSPSQAKKDDPAATQSSPSSQLDRSTAQAAGSDETDPDHAANPEQALVNNLASRSSLSEPNGVENKSNRTPTQSDSKTGQKTDSTQARNPGQELVTNLSSRTSNSEPNGVPGYDVDSSPAGAKSQDSDSSSSQSSGQKTEKKAVKKNSKPAAKAPVPAKKSGQAAANKPALKAATQATPKTTSKKPVATQGATSSSKKTSGKQASKSTSQAKPATSSGITFSSEDIGQVRYFLVNKPPYKPYVGRVIQVNGKTQVMMYNTDADAAKIRSMSHDPKKLRVEFESQNHADSYEYRTLSLDPEVSNRAIEEALVNQVLKKLK